MNEVSAAVRETEPRAGIEPSSLLLLAKAAAAGDSPSTAKLLRAVAPRLVAVVRAVLGYSHPDVDDAAQQALIGFVQALPAFRGDCDPVGYGRVIAVRAALAARKRARLRGVRCEPGVETDAMAAEGPSPRDLADASKRKQLLRELLDELPAEQAETIALRIVVGCSLEEVAQQTGAPLNTVRSRIRLAKERLKSRIEQDPVLAAALGVGE